jgi:hypothetical protein
LKQLNLFCEEKEQKQCCGTCVKRGKIPVDVGKVPALILADMHGKPAFHCGCGAAIVAEDWGSACSLYLPEIKLVIEYTVIRSKK